MRRQRELANIATLIFVIGGVATLIASAARSPLATKLPEHRLSVGADEGSIVEKVDGQIAATWHEAQIEPAEPADELTILRRLSLVLHGTTPSLEEIRLFESDDGEQRLERWTERLLADRRFADYFARRFSRVFVGAEQGQFVVFRRDRFWAWLGDQLHQNRAYDEIVRDMIARRGLWTDKPEVNFVASTVTDGVIDRNKLTGRTVRAFLGQRIDCAQCHNHPFAEWKQAQFEGLAACYGRVSISAVGIEDNMREPFKAQDQMTLVEREVAPAVPFHPEWLPGEGSERERLAAWVTHPDNRRFDRAIVNRVWGLLFGRAWIQPVDDLPNPDESDDKQLDPLDLLATDFRSHGRDLKRLIATIASTHVFRLSSQHPTLKTGERADEVERVWAAFPITRLRPEQVIGSMLQASAIKTTDKDSHWTSRAVRFFKELDFVKEYGDLGEDELTERVGTIPQALLRMNSQFAAEWTKSTPFSAAGRISGMAVNDDDCVELSFLVCLSRRPTAEERQAITPQLLGTKGEARSAVIEDLFWALFNGPEFCWEH